MKEKLSFKAQYSLHCPHFLEEMVMVVRSSSIAMDTVLCGIQGYAGAFVLNAVRGDAVISPLHGAVCLGGVALIERLFYEITSRYVPGSTGFLGPIPIGFKNIVSYGLAIYTMLKVMQVAGLILSVPLAVQIIGLGCAIALGAGFVWNMVNSGAEEEIGSSLEELKKHLASPVFANRVFRIEDPKTKRVHEFRVICNPEEKEVCFSLRGGGTISSSDSHIVASNEDISDFSKFQINGHSFFGVRMNGQMPLDYTANPQLI